MKLMGHYLVILAALFLRSVFAQLPFLRLEETVTPSSQEDPVVQVVTADNIKQRFKELTGITPNEFYVVSYAIQTVNRSFYFAKIRIDRSTYVHLRVYQPLSKTGLVFNMRSILSSVQTGRTLDDPIVYFERNYINQNDLKAVTAPPTTTARSTRAVTTTIGSRTTARPSSTVAAVTSTTTSKSTTKATPPNTRRFVASTKTASKDDPRWVEWKKTYHEQFDDDEEDDFYEENFLNTVKRIEQYRKESEEADEHIDFDYNYFSDWTLEQMEHFLTGFHGEEDETDTSNGTLLRRKRRQVPARQIVAPNVADDMALPQLPSEFTFPGEIVDWRKRGYMTAVKSQKQCGSCYIFGAVAVLESRLSLKNRQPPIQLSEQQVIDCGRLVPSINGCGGGSPGRVYQYVETGPRGLNRMAEYPYANTDSRPCVNNELTQIPIDIHGRSQIIGLNYEDLNQVVQAIVEALQKGPVSAGIRVVNDFYFYRGGIYEDPQCIVESIPDLNHVVTIVGYGTDPQYGDYWIARNSWGTTWGERGYFRIRKGNNMCGIEFFIEYPRIV